MSNVRILTEFLRNCSKNRTEQADLRLKDRVPNTQLIGKMRTEARMFNDAANIVAAQPPGVIPQTSEQSDRIEAAKAPAVIVKGTTKNGKKIGRPPKMTLKQIQEASQGKAQRAHAEPDTPENV
jgi:hypothetical protein